MDGASAASASKETGAGSSDTASTSYQQCNLSVINFL